MQFLFVHSWQARGFLTHLSAPPVADVAGNPVLYAWLVNTLGLVFLYGDILTAVVSP